MTGVFDKSAVDKLIDLMEQDSKTMDMYTSIFEYTQEIEATEEQKAKQKQTGKTLSKDDLRMGDVLRKHLVWAVWLDEVQKRLKESEASVARYGKELKEAQNWLAAFSGAAESQEARSTRGTRDKVVKHATTAEGEAKKVTEDYFCCLQFEHEGIGGIQAVRVLNEEGETLVVDNRTLHGGSRGETTSGFRFHAYGYNRDIQKHGVGPIQKDQDVTHDPLDEKHGFFPVCLWAQCSPGTPVFLS